MTTTINENSTPRDKCLYALKMLQLELLTEMDRICRKYDIPYYVSGGTCLGAVRHQGFIPWDDDVDIELFKNNFLKLVKVCKKELDHTKYELVYCDDNHPERFERHARLRLKGTVQSFVIDKRQNSKLKNSVHIDIIPLISLPNNEKKRKKLATKLYYLKLFLYFKDKGIARDIPEKYQKLIYKILNKISFKTLHKINNYYENRCKKPTDWVLDTSFEHGNYTGTPSSWRKDTVDLQFENLKVMAPINYMNYLEYFYGKNCMKLPKPIQRTSHRWGEVHLGPYEKNFDLPKNYEKYLISYLNEERLIQAKKLCLDIIDEIDRLCSIHDINYYITGNDALYKASDVEEYGIFWRNNVCISMDEENLKKFENLALKDLDKKYFYQNMKTDSNYKLYHPKIRLNETIFRDTTTFPADIHLGVWVDIDILINTTNDENLRKKQIKHYKEIYHKIRLKWLFNGKRILQLSKENKKIRKSLNSISLEELIKERNEILEQYKKEPSDYYISTINLNANTSAYLKKDFFKQGEIIEYLDHKYIFPKKLIEYKNSIFKDNKNISKSINKMAENKVNDIESYKNKTTNLSNKVKESINKKIGHFELSMYDHPDYKITVEEINNN